MGGGGGGGDSARGAVQICRGGGVVWFFPLLDEESLVKLMNGTTMNPNLGCPILEPALKVRRFSHLYIP